VLNIISCTHSTSNSEEARAENISSAPTEALHFEIYKNVKSHKEHSELLIITFKYVSK
jgi:hypothetical protein